MHLAVGAYRCEPGVLKNLAIYGNSITALEMRRQFRAALAQRAQQLPHIARLNLYLR